MTRPVGGKTDVTEQQLVEQLQGALIKWPRVHLYVLDALIKHLKEYILFLPNSHPIL